MATFGVSTETLSDHALLVDGDGTGGPGLILAHGAGAAMDSEFMNVVCQGLAEQGVKVFRFEFPYMAERRETGKRKLPSPQSRLLQTWREVIDQVGSAERLVIGGKSMGGRMASLLADEIGVRGLVCLGYPFHPSGKPEQLRTAHLQQVTTPTLIVQGKRDSLGSRVDVSGYGIDPGIRFVWMPDGDHSFKPRVKSGRTLEENLAVCVETVARFVYGLS